MKKILAYFAIFVALIFVISCGGGSKTVDTTDTGEGLNDEDTVDTDSVSDTEHSDDSDSDNPDTAPDSTDDDADTADTAPDSDPSDPINENPDNLPECSPTSATPCIDPETGLIWSGKAPERIRWIDAVDYCKNLEEGGYNDWRLPSIVVLRTLVQDCDLTIGCEGDTDGKYSKFGDIAFFWSSSSQGQGVLFYNGATQTKNVDENFDARCVRRDYETRQVSCTGLPEHAEWNSVSTITQTWDWDSASWTPSKNESYSENPTTTECGFKCEESYFWNSDSNECMKNPCLNNPCNIPNSTGICKPVTETQYVCICSSGYYWHGTTDKCKTEPPTLGKICTDQTKCYNNIGEITCPTLSSEDFFGQDAYYASLGKCVPQSFTVQTIVNQKVVLDNNTGLMWQQTISANKYTWGSAVSWDKAVSYCNNMSYAGYDDWRLPTPQELLTIVDNSKYDPAIDETYFPDTPSDSFGSSSTYVNNTSRAWIAHFSYGIVTNSNDDDSYYVRCVRGVSLQNSTFNSTTINGDVIVTDSKTGLVWQKTYETGKTWQQALKYCEDLTYAGYSDWRLPDKNELASLVNYEKYNPASDFPDMPSQHFWSSSTLVHYTNFAWVVYFNYGSESYGNKTDDDYNVRCVR